MEKIVERIRKLMQLAGNNPSEAEREAAMRKAHQLLIQHNLNIQDVQETVESVDVHPDTVAWKNEPWRRTILSAIAKLYFCQVVFSVKERKVRANFVGMRVDAEVAKAVSNSILVSLAHQAELHHRANGGGWVSFANGAAQAIYWRCMDMIETAQNEKVPGTALVVQSLYETRVREASAVIAVRWPTLRKSGKGMSAKDASSRQAGVKFGQTVALTQKVT
jgi:hypothetical protein